MRLVEVIAIYSMSLNSMNEYRNIFDSFHLMNLKFFLPFFFITEMNEIHDRHFFHAAIVVAIRLKCW